MSRSDVQWVAHSNDLMATLGPDQTPTTNQFPLGLTSFETAISFRVTGFC